MIRLMPVGPGERDALWNVIGPDGNYPYRHFDAYFASDPGRQAFFFYDGPTLIGFSMVNAHPFLERRAGHCLAEFSVFPACRGRGLGTAAAETLFHALPGDWQLKYTPRNETGARFWKRVTAPYGPRVTPLSSGESVLSFTVSE